MSGLVREVIVCDGGSSDRSCEIADDAGCVIVQGEKGRGAQLRQGVQAARGDWFLFLHADTALENGWSAEVAALVKSGEQSAAYFRFAADRQDHRARRLAFWVNVRCAAFALPYGDQGLVVSRRLYDNVGGFRPLPLMEDVDLVRRLGRRRLLPLRSRAFTSVDKHVRDGYWRRSFANLWLLTQFLCGADPAELAKRYG